MADVYDMLCQVQGTGAASSVYARPANKQVIIREIVIVNTTSSNKTFKLYLDNDGTTYDATTQILSSTTIPANSTYERQCHIGMNTAGGHLAMDGPATLTLTAWGVVRS